MGSNGNGVEAGLNKCPIVCSLFSASIDQLVLDNTKVKSQGFREIVCWKIFCRHWIGRLNETKKNNIDFFLNVKMEKLVE